MFDNRVIQCFRRAWRPALKNALWLLKIIIPVTFLVSILQYFGIIQWISTLLTPAFKLIGLSGEAALVLVTGGLSSIYAAIAVMQSIPFSVKEATILSVMCLIAHNLIVETTVQKRTGSSPINMVVTRIVGAVLVGYILSRLVPENNSTLIKKITTSGEISFGDMILNWVKNTFILIAKVISIIVGLNFMQKLLEEFGIMNRLSKIFTPVMTLMGLPKNTAFSWIIANIVGLAYGAGSMIEQFEQGKITRKENNLLNYHIAVSHSILEDTLLFVAIGVAFGWLVIPRIVLAIIVVWFVRFWGTVLSNKPVPIKQRTDN